MPDGDIFTNSLHGGWRKVYRAFVGRQPPTHKLACISEALRGCVGSGNTAKAVGVAVGVLESALKDHSQEFLNFEESPESPAYSFQSRLTHALAECGGGKSVLIVKEVAASVFAECQGAYVFDGSIEKRMAEGLTRRLLAGQCLDLVKDKLAESGITTYRGYEEWFEQEFGTIYPPLQQAMEEFVVSHGAKTPKKFVSVAEAAVNSSDYLTQPLAILSLPGDSNE
ncbi:MAG: hypothetical protein ACREBW_04520 [Candidatus Micrarchaeaceae archaeon]